MIIFLKKYNLFIIILSMIVFILGLSFFLMVNVSPNGKTYHYVNAENYPTVKFYNNKIEVIGEYTTNTYNYELNNDNEIILTDSLADDTKVGDFKGYKIIDDELTLISTSGIILHIVSITFILVSVFSITSCIIVYFKYMKNTKNKDYKFNKIKK